MAKKYIRIGIFEYIPFSGFYLSFYKCSRKNEIGTKHHIVKLNFWKLDWWKDLFTKGPKSLHSSTIVSTVHPDVWKKQK